MRGQNKTPEQLEVERRQTHLVKRVGDLKNAETRIIADYEEKIRPHVLVKDTQLEPIERELHAIIAELVALLEVQRGDKSTFTITLPSGKATLSTSATALDVTDEAEFFKLARKLRIVTRVSKQPPRELQKTKIKALIGEVPKLYRKLSDLLVQPQTTLITIKPAHFDGEVKQEVSKTTVPYPPPKGSFDQPALFS